MTKWNSPQLQASSDTQHRAKYRLLQSWYREHILEVMAGIGPYRKAPVGSMLPADQVARNRALNFIDESVAEYARNRSKEVLAQGGTLDEDRLFRNMLSSMPLCFNLFGVLRNHKEPLAMALSRLLDLDIHQVEQVEVEWTPGSAHLYLGDKTAFDAAIHYRKRNGTAGLVGIETKYTEPFSQKEYSRDRYTQLTQARSDVFNPGAERLLVKAQTNQLWRNALLGLAIQEREVIEFHSVVLYCDGDAAAEEAAAAFRSQLSTSAHIFHALTIQRLTRELAKSEALHEWSGEFRRRYLDLSPLAA